MRIERVGFLRYEYQKQERIGKEWVWNEKKKDYVRTKGYKVDTPEVGEINLFAILLVVAIVVMIGAYIYMSMKGIAL